MDTELLGYLLNAVDDATRRQVERRLDEDAHYQHQLQLLRGALEPLAADAEAPAPPPGLVANTIARVAEHMCRPLPQAPVPRFDRPIMEAPWWRRADVLLAACLLVAVVGIAGPMLLRAHLEKSQTAQCQEKLRTFHAALEAYHDHHGSYPHIADQKRHAAAGMMVPLLRNSGMLKSKPAACSVGKEPNDLPLDQLLGMDPETFVRHAPDLNPDYAYSLGFVGQKGYRAPSRSVDGTRSQIPLMSDAPHCDGSGGNSPNHGGHGQNVLYQDGHVRFVKTRLVGFNGDDIFRNKSGHVAAGLDALDTVLGCSAAKP